MSVQTADGFQNLLAGQGMGAANLNSQASYQFAFYSRSRVLMEAMYRGSWIVSKVVNIVADDMTRAGINLLWPGDPDAPTKINRALTRLQIWPRLNSCLRWARLFGGSVGVLMIDGQQPNTPLNYASIGKRQFRGIFPMDRWMLTPSSDLVTDIGPNFGKPVSYQVVSGAGVPFAGLNIHHTRILRFEGLELPYYQRMSEYGWGLSVIEPLYDRMVAFDTATHGTSNLIHKAHLRVYKLKGFRGIVAGGDKLALAGIAAAIDYVRQTQTNEGMTIVDFDDEIEYNNYTFSGLSDVILQFSQQLSGAADIPITRLFGQAPGGLNSTGDSDLRNYYDKIGQGQESHLREPIEAILQCVSQSELGRALDEDADYHFNPLWQLSDSEKANIAKADTDTILAAQEAALITDQQALRELQASSRITGRWASISDEDVEAAEDTIPDPVEMAGAMAKATSSAAGEVKADPTSEQPGE